MKSKKIASIPGDGIGNEVIAEGLLLLRALCEKEGYAIEVLELDLGAERYLRDGATFPEEVRAQIAEECDAVLLGALGDPRVPDLGYARDILFGLRFGFDLYCNIRPIVCLHDRLMPLAGRSAADCDMVVFRENTEGIYVGVGGQFKRGTPDEIAINEDINTRKGVERVIRAAFDHARATGRRKVTMADKSNAMRHAHELWRRVFAEVAAEHPEIESQAEYVDALCYKMIRDPSQFEVIVTNNLFGDIVTDLGAALQGGLGMASSANVHPGKMGMFEPVHGSAPDIAGRGVANPLATFLTIGQMLSYLGFEGEEAKLQAIVRRAVEEDKTTPDLGGKLSTSEVGAWARGLI